MSNEQEDHEFRLKPHRPRRSPPDESRIWSTAFVQVMRMARMSRRKLMAPTSPRPRPSYLQRYAVRVTYSQNRVAGQWAAHGRYVTRNGAMPGSTAAKTFGPNGPVNSVPNLLATWQKAGDKRLFKLIISGLTPIRFGDDL